MKERIRKRYTIVYAKKKGLAAIDVYSQVQAKVVKDGLAMHGYEVQRTIIHAKDYKNGLEKLDFWTLARIIEHKKSK